MFSGCENVKTFLNVEIAMHKFGFCWLRGLSLPALLSNLSLLQTYIMPIKRNIDIALLLLRIVFGGFMIYGHGWGKLMRLFGGEEIKFADPFGIGPAASLALAVFAEVICALCVMVGFYTRWTVIPLMFTMLVAYFSVHYGDPFGRVEKLFMFLFAYAALFFIGSGWKALQDLPSVRD